MVFFVAIISCKETNNNESYYEELYKIRKQLDISYSILKGISDEI